MHQKLAGKIVAVTTAARDVRSAGVRGSRRLSARHAEAAMNPGADEMVCPGGDGLLQRELREVDMQPSSNAAA